ncbi:MAG: YkgJ family cysteine cluster protein [Prolixibacteraceae bacterium]|nr:YkgJ family cysteine cluster protein [Prolixibacteraceae bacterium]
MDNRNKYYQRLDETMFTNGYNLCTTHLSVGAFEENLLKAQKYLYEVVDDFVSSFLNEASNKGVSSDCKMGCLYCCHQTVLATPPELFYLTDFIKKKFQGNVLNSIKEKARAKMAKTGKMKLDKLLNYKEPCPLLHPTGGYCRAYQARPVACRIFLSKSVKSCEDDLNFPEDAAVFPDLFEMPIRLGRMLSEGFHARLRKGKESLQFFENTLEGGIFTAFEKGSFEKWLKGENVFKAIKS